MARPLSPQKAARIVALVREGYRQCEVMAIADCARISVEKALAALPPSERPEPAEDFVEVDLGRVAALLDREGMDYVHAARLLGCTAAKVIGMMQGLPADCRPKVERRGRPSTIDVDKAIALREEGLSLRAVAEALGCTAAGVQYAVRKGRPDESQVPPPWRFFASDPAGGVPFTPAFECVHPPIPKGSTEYCLACDSCGYDDRFKAVRKLPPSVPAKSDPRRKWSAEARSDAGKLAEAEKTLTRRERRALAFAKGEADRARELVARLSGTGRLDAIEREGDHLMKLHGYSGSADDRAWQGLSLMARAVASPVGAC